MYIKGFNRPLSELEHVRNLYGDRVSVSPRSPINVAKELLRKFTIQEFNVDISCGERGVLFALTAQICCMNRG